MLNNTVIDTMAEFNARELVDRVITEPIRSAELNPDYDGRDYLARLLADHHLFLESLPQGQRKRITETTIHAIQHHIQLKDQLLPQCYRQVLEAYAEQQSVKLPD
jgi:hypothetical protein